MYVKEFSKWEAFHMDFIDWLIATWSPLNIGFQSFFPILTLKYELFMDFWDWDFCHFRTTLTCTYPIKKS
jgi:hypothetical protein